MNGLHVLMFVGGVTMLAGNAADAAVYLGYGELNGYVSSSEGVFDVHYYGDMRVEFETRLDAETANTEVMVNLTSLDVADWLSGEDSGAGIVSLGTGSFARATSGPGGSGEVYDPFQFDISGTALATNLFLAPEWYEAGGNLDLAADVQDDPFSRGGPLRFVFHGTEDITVVPEPASLLVLGSVLALAGVRSRRRRG